MHKYINISEVTGFKPTLDEYNVIKVDTSYKKGTWLVVYIQEWKLEKENKCFDSFSFDLYGSKRTWLLVLWMTRKNAKKIQLAEEEFFKKSNQEITNILINKTK